jgi:hypothetical protein
MKQIRNVVSSTLIASVVSQKSLSFICHSGLDPESIVYELDSCFRRNDDLGINIKKR